MTIKFRNFDASDRDYGLILQVHDRVWPDDPVTVEIVRHRHETRNPKHYYQSVIGEVDGQVVGTGSYNETWWNKNDGEYQIRWATVPDQRNQGYATAFYDYALAKVQADRPVIKQLRSWTREDQTAGVAYLEKRGYTITNRYQRSELRMDAYDPTQFAHYAKRMDQHGIVIRPLAEIQKTDADWQRKLWDLEWVLEQDEPSSDLPERTPFEDYVKNTLDAPDFTPESWFIATDGDAYIGLSAFWKDDVLPDRLHTGWTGVDRPYRRKGIAVAMKARALQFAREYGATHIRTDNHDTNFMYQINLRLGFKPIPADATFVKKMEGNN